MKVEIPKQTLTVFDSWTRKITNTEIVAARLSLSGVLDLNRPEEWSSVYRVQPKTTGCEGRNALCYLGRRVGCEDIRGRWGKSLIGDFFDGIDLLDSVAHLAKAESITLESKDYDPYLWVYVTKT
jgi:hypothetical protein